MKRLLFIGILVLTRFTLTGQITTGELTGADLNTIQTAVPFLTIAPDARAAGMGDVGAASKPDMHSQHWNVAKLAFIENKVGISFSHTPWLNNLISGINLEYLAGYYRIDKKNTVSGSFRYFSLGTITYAISGGVVTGHYRPREFAFDAGYSRLFSEHFSGGIVLRTIYSDLISGQITASGSETNAGTSVAGDLGIYYQNDLQAGTKGAQWALGALISNAGTPVSYTMDADPAPIPTNLRIGGRFELDFNENHSISLNTDMNKLLVPTPPVYVTDTATGGYVVLRGKAPPESILAGMFQSFSDAPGIQQPDGSYSILLEELYEISYGFGIEYNFKDLLAVRTGYFHEHATKGNRKYFTTGICVRNPVFSLEASYLAPTNGRNSPLANTFRITFTTRWGSNSKDLTPPE